MGSCAFQAILCDDDIEPPQNPRTKAEAEAAITKYKVRVPHYLSWTLA